MADIQHRVPSSLWPERIKQHWKLFLVEGGVLILLGIAALLVPLLASLAIAIFLGWLFLIGGVVGFLTAIRPATHRVSGGR